MRCTCRGELSKKTPNRPWRKEHENAVFDVSPLSATVNVQLDHATVFEKFQVTVFFIGGRVVDSQGKGVDGVKIVVDGVERFLTDKKGYYKLDPVTSKQYLIEAKKEHYKFDKLTNVMVLPNMASIANIKSLSYDVCGSVHTIDSGYKAKVALTHGSKSQIILRHKRKYETY